MSSTTVSGLQYTPPNATMRLSSTQVFFHECSLVGGDVRLPAATLASFLFFFVLISDTCTVQLARAPSASCSQPTAKVPGLEGQESFFHYPKQFSPASPNRTNFALRCLLPRVPSILDSSLVGCVVNVLSPSRRPRKAKALPRRPRRARGRPPPR